MVPSCPSTCFDALSLPPCLCLHLQFWSNGISACAICDGASALFKDREVAVVGGGDSAAEEAVYLTKYATRVHLLVRGPQMRASKAMADRASSHPKVQVHYNTAVEDGYGSSVLEVRPGIVVWAVNVPAAAICRCWMMQGTFSQQSGAAGWRDLL